MVQADRELGDMPMRGRADSNVSPGVGTPPSAVYSKSSLYSMSPPAQSGLLTKPDKHSGAVQHKIDSSTASVRRKSKKSAVTVAVQRKNDNGTTVDQRKSAEMFRHGQEISLNQHRSRSMGEVLTASMSRSAILQVLREGETVRSGSEDDVHDL